MKQIFLIFFVFLFFTSSAQDTIFLQPKNEYFSPKDDYRFTERYSKRFPIVYYSTEKIIFSPDSIKFEHCYYYNNKRFIKENLTEIYYFKNDSTLIINNTTWYYKQQSDTLFSVYHISDSARTEGQVTKLIPFVKIGIFTFYYNNFPKYFINYDKNSCISGIKTVNKGNIVFVAEQMPEFPGGEQALRQFIAENIKYPEISQECDIQGTVYVRFVVTKQGIVTNITIIRGVDRLLDDEAIRVISILPNFKPAMQNGKPVNCWYIVPIRIHLQIE